MKLFNNYQCLANKTSLNFLRSRFKRIRKNEYKKFKNSGGILLIDYGYDRDFKYLYYSITELNIKKNEVFKNLGKADITYLVNFKLFKEFFENKKLKTKY